MANTCRGKGRDSVPQELWKRNALMRAGHHRKIKFADAKGVLNPEGRGVKAARR